MAAVVPATEATDGIPSRTSTGSSSSVAPFGRAPGLRRVVGGKSHFAPLMFGVVGVVCGFSFGGSDSAGFGASVGTTLSDGAGVTGFGVGVVESVFAGAGAGFLAVATACGARTATEAPDTA